MEAQAAQEPEAGGSGYVYTSATASNYPSGCLLNSTYYLTQASTIAGNNSMPSTTGSTETGHSENGYARITCLGEEEPEDEGNIAVGTIMNFDYTGTVQTKELCPGTYKLEVWGAQGGDASNGSTSTGGKGGYSVGNVYLSSIQLVYVFVGQKGTETNNINMTTGGYNGGGGNYSAGGGATGGGATDVRLNSDSLYSRIIVAGGGSGAAWGNINGASGGGTSGISGTQWSGGYASGIGGNQYSGGGYSGTTTAGGQKQSITSGTFGSGGAGSGSSSGGSGGRRWMVWRSVEDSYLRGAVVQVGYTLNQHSIHGNQEIQLMQTNMN